MANCIVYKLIAVVNNDNLLKLNELKLKYKENGVYITLNFKEASTITCTENMTVDNVNVGKSYTIQAGGANQKNVYAPKDAVLTIENKYKLATITMQRGTSVDFEHLGYNDITLSVAGSGTTDELKHFQGKYLSVANADITGDIAKFKDAVLNYCSNGCVLLVPGTYGNIEVFTGLTRKIPRVSGYSSNTDAYTGDLMAVLATTTDNMITGAWYYITGVSGDISTARADLYYISLQSDMSWKTTRPSSYPIIMLSGVDLGEDVDAMLINQASCSLADDSHYTDGSTVRKIISVRGTHTPGATVNAAIQTLTAMGISVKVNGNTLTGNEPY